MPTLKTHHAERDDYTQELITRSVMATLKIHHAERDDYTEDSSRGA